MDDSLIASLFLLNSPSTSTGYCSALDDVERRDCKFPEVICTSEDSPLDVSSTVNEQTPSTTPCSSVFEDVDDQEDASSVQEVFVSSVVRSSRPPVIHIQDDEVSTTNTGSFETLDDLSLQETAEKVNTWQETNEQEQEPSTTSSTEVRVRDFTLPCLETITSLKSRYESKYELHLKLRKAVGGRNKSFRRKLYKYKKDLHQQLDDWEAYLNEQSPNEAYIAVENIVDNEGPPQDFTYTTNNILHKDIPSHLFDIDYLVGCSCERICTMDTCDCPRNSGGVFAYDRNGRVRVNPGTPIYECNSRCPCGLSCRNRVLQRGRKVKVAIFRTPNGCGWGVKTMELIEKNQLVTEYVGEAITQEEAEERGRIYDSCGQTYLFDLDFNEGECLYTLDAKKYGNISHFINHSCDPNLDVYAVWVDTLDPNFPRIAFFANRNIKKGEELTFDYQMTSDVGSNTPSPRKREHIKCNCGAKNCRTYLF